MRNRDHHTHNRARDLRSKYTSRAARRDEEYYDTDNVDIDNDFSMDDYYAQHYDKEYMGGYHQRYGSNYGRELVPRDGYEADFQVYDVDDRSDYDLNDGLDIDVDIDRHYRYEKEIPRRRLRNFPPASPRRRRH